MPAKWMFVLATIASLLASFSVASALGQPAASSKTTVATVTTVDHRAVVVASKASGGGAPTAEVSVDAFVRAHGSWHRVAEQRLAGTFFWNTVAAPNAVCRLELASAGSPAATHLSVTVQLLTSPSIGCGRAQTVRFPAA